MEIAIKINLKKLEIGMSFDELYVHVVKNSFEILPLTVEHTANLITIEPHHKDPFDRMLISQAQVESMGIIGKDQNFKLYSINLIW